jgi:hypothetical protein
MDQKIAFLSKTRIFLSDPKLLNGNVFATIITLRKPTVNMIRNVKTP